MICFTFHICRTHSVFLFSFTILLPSYSLKVLSFASAFPLNYGVSRFLAKMLQSSTHITWQEHTALMVLNVSCWGQIELLICSRRSTLCGGRKFQKYKKRHHVSVSYYPLFMVRYAYKSYNLDMTGPLARVRWPCLVGLSNCVY